MKNEKWDDVHGNTTPDDRMVAFLESPTDSYAILQLREDVDDNIPLMFANYSYLQKKEMEPEIDRYEVVYHGSISVSEDVDRQLEDLYVKFNIDHPEDFRGHSMSVSDIVALKIAGEALWGLMAMVIILGGILSGIFTATDALNALVEVIRGTGTRWTHTG